MTVMPIEDRAQTLGEEIANARAITSKASKAGCERSTVSGAGVAMSRTGRAEGHR